MRVKVILFFLGLVVLTACFFSGNAGAALPEDQPKGPAILHSLAGGDSVLTDASGLVCTWWRQIWECRNLYHIKEYVDNGDGIISACDYIKVDLTEAYGEPVGPYESWKHIERVTVTLELGGTGTAVETLFVEFSGGIHPDSLSRIRFAPVSTWWHEVYPEECVWWHIAEWQDNGDGELDSCDYIVIERIEVYHVVSVQVGPVDLSLKLEGQGGYVDSMRVVFSGGLDPDSVERALTSPEGTWWHEIWPEFCNWWLLESWTDNGSLELDSCDYIVIKTTEVWHVEDVATDIEVVTSDPPPEGAIPTMTEWGLVILAILIAGSAVFLWLRRRRVAVSP